MPSLQIANRQIGPGNPTYVIAEMSANHNQSFDTACEILHAMKESCADAVKLQTYTPDTMTIDCDREEFIVGKGTIWEGRKLYELYGEAMTPWEWQPELKRIADDLGMDLFSTPFDRSAVDFLEEMDVPCYKIASFELVDIPLIEYVASKGKPMIMSTGMATMLEVCDAVETVRKAGNEQLALLKCTSAYPSLPEEMNLRTIPHMKEAFGVPVGLSDHTLGTAVPVAAVALGASIIEKHFTLSRNVPGPDSPFSLEPHEFKAMVEAVRTVESALGSVEYKHTKEELASKVFRRSIRATRMILPGELLSSENVRSIRPGGGLPPKYLSIVHGRVSSRPLDAGQALTWADAGRLADS